MENNKLVNFSIIFIAIVLLALVLKTLQSFLRPFAIAILLLFLLIPLINYSKKKNIPFWLVLTGIFVILILIMSLITILLSNGISKESSNLEDETNLEESISIKTNKFLNSSEKVFSKVGLSSLFNILESYITPEKITNLITKTISSILKGLSTILQESFLVIIFLMFLIPSHKYFENNFLKTVSKKNIKKFKATLIKIEESVPNYLVVKSIISLVTALISAIVLSLFGANLLVITLSAIIIFILNFIPNIGSIIAVLLALILYLIDNGIGLKFFILGIILTIIQVTIGNYIEPKYFGKKFKMSPIVVLLSLFLWYWIWGLAGMILAVPLTSMIKITLENIKSTKHLAKLLE